MRTKAEAERLGQALLKKMKGEGWELRVHENLGWHYCVWNGAMSVMQSSQKGSYYALLGDRNRDHYSAGGLAVWSDDESYKDPNDAVRMQLFKARKHVNGLSLTIGTLETRIL